MDPNWIMAIIAISAILSPTVVSIIDNVFKYKSKKLELSSPNQREALSNFVTESLMIYIDSTYADMIRYNIAKNNLYVYFENVNDKYFEELEFFQNKKDLNSYKNVINKIIKELSQQINKWYLF